MIDCALVVKLQATVKAMVNGNEIAACFPERPVQLEQLLLRILYNALHTYVIISHHQW